MERPSVAMVFWRQSWAWQGVATKLEAKEVAEPGDVERTDEKLKEEKLKDEDLRVGVAIPSTRLARSKDAVTTEHSIVGLRCGRNELDGAGWNGDLGLSSQEA